MGWQSFPIFLGIGVFFIIVYHLYKLYQIDKFVTEHIMLQITHQTGRTDFKAVKKEGNSVSIPHKDGTSEMWVIDKTCTRTMAYPIGAALRILRRDIDMVELDADDWEPIPFRKSEKGEQHIVGSPRLLGTLFNEKVAAAIVGMGKEFTDAIRHIKGLNPTYMLFGGLLLGAGIVFNVMQTTPIKDALPSIINKLDTIIKLLGG